ncbi:MAG TPA: hypothetical protein VMW56_08075 [Candidatus Margulisiibacteriota bacterium]|nr:hypothetical protein [Candidatus Margulisiibacteriota bacterium]
MTLTPQSTAPATEPDVADDGQPARREEALDEALEETFPASDPIAIHPEE